MDRVLEASKVLTTTTSAIDISPLNLKSRVEDHRRTRTLEWTEQNLQALAYCAEGRFTTLEIAMATGLTASAVRTLRKNEEFQLAVSDLTDQYRSAIAEIGLANKVERVKLYADRLERIQQVIEEREASATSEEAAASYGIAFNPELAAQAGGKSGLLLHNYKLIGTGKDQMLVNVFEVDNSTLRVEADLSKQLAQELGQFTEKTESTIVRKLYIGVSIDDI